MKVFKKLPAICGLIFVLSPFCRGQDDEEDYAPFTSQVLRVLATADAHVLFYAAKYLNSDFSSKLKDNQAEKAQKLVAFLGNSVPVGPRPGDISTADYMKEMRKSLFEKFSDRAFLLEELVRVATSLDDPEGKNCRSAYFRSRPRT